MSVRESGFHLFAFIDRIGVLRAQQIGWPTLDGELVGIAYITRNAASVPLRRRVHRIDALELNNVHSAGDRAAPLIAPLRSRSHYVTQLG